MPVEQLSRVDAAYLRMETPRTPMHTARLLVFSLPPDAGADWLNGLVEDMRRAAALGGPYVRRLDRPGRFRRSYRWIGCDGVDLDHHVKHWTLPAPGDDSALNALLWDIYPKGLDMKKPLWECHVIGNMEGRRFGLLLKIHHAAQDGFGATTFLRRWLTEDPMAFGAPGPWALPQAAGLDEAGPVTHAKRAWIGGGSDGERGTTAFRDGLRARIGCARLRRMMRRLRRQGTKGGLLGALSAPRTPFNARLSPYRAFARVSFDLGRLQALSKRTATTVNDVALAIIGGAIRRYLEDRNALPDRPLVASVPVGLPRRDNKVGNVGTALFCTLGTDDGDPIRRLQAIHDGTQQAKALLADPAADVIERITACGTARLIRGQLFGLSSWQRPFFNIAVSNGIYGHEPLYLRGARLVTSYPCSIVFDGYALNVTVVGYAGVCSIGYTGCPVAIPDLEKLSAFTADALAELEKHATIKVVSDRAA